MAGAVLRPLILPVQAGPSCDEQLTWRQGRLASPPRSACPCWLRPQAAHTATVHRRHPALPGTRVQCAPAWLSGMQWWRRGRRAARLAPHHPPCRKAVATLVPSLPVLPACEQSSPARGCGPRCAGCHPTWVLLLLLRVGAAAAWVQRSRCQRRCWCCCCHGRCCWGLMICVMKSRCL